MHCIWIVPEEPELELLRGLIDRLSAIGGGPRFEPHVTILSGIPLEAEISPERLVSAFERIPAFELSMTATGSGNAFFKSLYLLPEPSDALARLRLLAEEQLPANSRSVEFDPHLSMAYGKFRAAELRRMRDMVDRSLPVSVRFERATVVLAAGSIPVEDWRPMGSIAFGEPRSENSGGRRP